MLACLGYVTNSSPKPILCLISSLFTKVIIYHNAKYASRFKYVAFLFLCAKYASIPSHCSASII